MSAGSSPPMLQIATRVVSCKEAIAAPRSSPPIDVLAQK
jgi:hypothetical protein